MRKMLKIGFFLVGIVLMSPFFANAQSLTPEQRAVLEGELKQVEAEQRQAEIELTSAQKKSSSLNNDIAVLDAKIKKAQLNIKAKTLLIQTLGNDIVAKQKHIDNLEQHIAKGKESISDILRITYELDSYSLPEIILSQKTIAGFFQDVDSFDAVHSGLQGVVDQLKTDERSTSAEKNSLDQRRTKESDARFAIQQEQKNIENDQNQKRILLSASKSSEKTYASLAAQKRARAASIKAQLFALRDAAPIPFGQALQYANIASQKTGVRPAYILAVLTQESSLGKNVGQCNVTNFETGDGINVRSGKAMEGVMNPKRDVPVFIDILKRIGGDPSRQVVSCPLDIGWGGAMGPAQFIPSTWVMFAERIASAVGISGEPDPWNPSHAFMAAAIYLGDLGASGKTYTAERNAACKYYSGRSCGLVKGNTSYGNSVVAQADNIQRNMIDPLQGL